jgi:hypothetical protein
MEETTCLEGWVATGMVNLEKAQKMQWRKGSVSGREGWNHAVKVMTEQIKEEGMER